MKEIFSRDELGLDVILSKYFGGQEEKRVTFLWLSIARILSIPPGKLRPGDNIVELSPNSKWSAVNVKLDDLTDFVIKESRGREVPKNMKTVKALIDFLSAAE